MKEFFLTIYKASIRPREAYRDLAASPPRSAQAALVGVLALLLVFVGVFIARFAWPFAIFAGLLAFNWIASVFSQNRSLAWSAIWLSLSPVLLIAGVASPFLVLGLVLGWLSPTGVALPLLAAFNPVFSFFAGSYLWLAGGGAILSEVAMSAFGFADWTAVLVVAVQAGWHFVSLYAGAKELGDLEQPKLLYTILLRLLGVNAFVAAIPYFFFSF